MQTLLPSVFKNKKVLVTGHTGFKGAWLCTWLHKLGADVVGVALAPPEGRLNLFNAIQLSESIESIFADICDYQTIQSIYNDYQPEIILHLAAQALVRPSYKDPVNTYAVNVLGTTHILEAARHCPSVKSIVVVTSDKCYQNKEWLWGYRENDRLGGKDPYSASKACAELVAHSYIESVYPLEGRIKLATARGGNVIGGGDWALDRLVPDTIESLRNNRDITLRNPQAIRPWQHVLELCYGYLTLAAQLQTSGKDYIGSWNFGPKDGHEVTVEWLTKKLAALWGNQEAAIHVIPQPLPEANFLRLDPSKAESLLNWRSVLNIEETLSYTVEWYKNYYKNPAEAANLVSGQIEKYTGLLQ